MRRGLPMPQVRATPEYRAAAAALNPSPENVHLEALRFVSTTVRAARDAGLPLFESEKAQRVAVFYEWKKAHRRLTRLESERLERASKAFWMACEKSPPVWKQLIGRPR